jgi:hypothetical protein
MKQVVKSIYNILRFIINYLSSYSFFNRINFPIKDSNELHILGNGPSLYNELDDIIKQNKIYFVVNGFANSDLYSKIQPKYYILVDPLYWDDTILNSDMEKEREVLNMILIKTKWDLILFIPRKGKNFFKKYFQQNLNIKIFGFNDLVLETHWFKFNHWFYERNLATIQFQNVLAASIFLGINMKYPNIYLYGTDHSWIKNITLNKQNEVCIKHDHFYEIEENLLPWMSNNGTIYKMHEILFDLHNIFKGYHKLKSYAEFGNVNIINLTKESFIDAFPKIS